MKRFAAMMATGAFVLGATQFSFASSDLEKNAERLTSATEILNQLMATPDKGIPTEILSGASCVVVVPSFKKAAFVFGGQYGQGVATCRTGHGWSAPAFVQLAGGSFGFQIGVQGTDLVLVAMNQQGLQAMLHNKFKLGADASAAAGPVGRHASAGTDWKLNAEFLTYSRSKGLFAGLDLSGDVLSENEDQTHAQYGKDVNYEDILNGHVPVPADGARFVRTVARYFKASR